MVCLVHKFLSKLSKAKKEKNESEKKITNLVLKTKEAVQKAEQKPSLYDCKI